MGAAIAIYGEQSSCCRRDRCNDFSKPVRTGAIHLAKRFIGDGTGLFLKKYAVFRQHRELSEAVFLILTIQYIALKRR